MPDRDKELHGADAPAEPAQPLPPQPQETAPAPAPLADAAVPLDADDPVADPDSSPVVGPPYADASAPELPEELVEPMADQEPTVDSDAESGPYNQLFTADDVRSQSGVTGDSDAEAEVDGDVDPLFASDETDETDDGTAVDDDDDGDIAEVAPRRVRFDVLIAGILLLGLVGGGIWLISSRWRNGGGDAQTIARVGQIDITRGEFTRSWTEGQDAKEVLDQLIDLELVAQEARTEGTAIDDKKVDEQVVQLKAQHGNDEAQFLTFLQKNNIASEAALRSLIGRQQLIEAMVLKHTTLEQARASHILLAGDNPDAIAKRKTEAEDLLKQIQGGADFSKLAEEKSDDPGSKVKGGDLGWAPRGVFVPEFDEAVFSMKPGELRLVQSQFGWHIIKLQNAAEVRGLETQDYWQTPPVMTAFNSTFLPWMKGLRTDAEQKGAVKVLVQPTELVPTPAPVQPTVPAEAPGAPTPASLTPAP